jgi:hypothetical protein
MPGAIANVLAHVLRLLVLSLFWSCVVNVFARPHAGLGRVLAGSYSVIPAVTLRAHSAGGIAPDALLDGLACEKGLYNIQYPLSCHISEPKASYEHAMHAMPSAST